jgi:hypothetical protein
MFPLPSILWFEIGAFLVSLLSYQKIKDTPLKWFIPYLFFLVCVELSAHYLVAVLKVHNVRLYNISVPIEYCFYAYLFYHYLQGPMIKKTALFLAIFIPSFSFINLLFAEGFNEFSTTNLLVSSTVVVVLCCAYFVDLFKREEEISLLREPMFWITTGVLFFNMGELSTNMFWQYLLRNTSEEYSKLIRMINGALIYVLYTFISIGLLCIKKTYRKMSSKSFGQHLQSL